MQAGSKVASSDASLYSFDPATREFASSFMGWTRLCTDPPVDPAMIDAFAAQARQEGLDAVVLIGQGGSSQAPMTMASVLDAHGRLPIEYRTLDVMSGEALSVSLEKIDPARTIFIVSSKSGSTLEPTMMSRCVWERVRSELGEAAGSRFVAITDPGSSLEALATELGYRAIFNGSAEVGGRFSALSVFGLVPMSLMGIDSASLLERLSDVQRECSVDSISNPALSLAAFLHECYLEGRDKICLNFGSGCGSLGLWIEQLVAESLGKHGKGMMPAIESDISMLGDRAADMGDRCAIVYSATIDHDGERRASAVSGDVPSIRLEISSPEDVAAHMLVWEYAIAMLGALLEVNPFDQPDVESTKVAVRTLLSSEAAADRSSGMEAVLGCGPICAFEVSEGICDQDRPAALALRDALSSILLDLPLGSYVSMNAFIPDSLETVEGLDALRRQIELSTGRVACLEFGPRYLHSVGQYQKGGPNTGAFLIISAESDSRSDVQVPGECYMLGDIARAQARGDFAALCDSGRRAVHVRLEGASANEIAAFADLCTDILQKRE